MAHLHRRVQELRRRPPTHRRARPVVGEPISPDCGHRPRISSGLAHINNAQEDRGDPPTDAAHEARPAATNMDTGTDAPSAVRPLSHPNIQPGASWLGPQPVPRGPGSPPSPERPPVVINPAIWGPPGVANAANPFPGNPNIHRPPRQPSRPNDRPGASWLGPQPVPRGPGSPPSPERPPVVINPSIWVPPSVPNPADAFPGNPNLDHPQQPQPPPPPSRRRGNPNLDQPPQPRQRRRPRAPRRSAAAFYDLFREFPIVPPRDRGYWTFDTATWPAATRAAFRTALRAPGVYRGSRRYDRYHSETVQRRGTEFRVYTMRMLSGSTWRRLIADSDGWLETVRAVWYDGNGYQITLMVPRPSGGAGNDGG